MHRPLSEIQPGSARDARSGCCSPLSTNRDAVSVEATAPHASLRSTLHTGGFNSAWGSGGLGLQADIEAGMLRVAPARLTRHASPLTQFTTSTNQRSSLAPAAESQGPS